MIFMSHTYIKNLKTILKKHHMTNNYGKKN